MPRLGLLHGMWLLRVWPVSSEIGDVHVFQIGREYKPLAVNPLGEICMATPAISQGVLFFHTQRHVVAVGE